MTKERAEVDPGEDAAEAETGFLRVDGRKLECAFIGPRPGSGPTLVFLHPGLGCLAMWRDFPARLAEATGLGAMVYSRLGHGGSEPCAAPLSPGFMHHEGLEVLPAVLAAAGVGEAILVGHSDGASIALIYAGGTPAAPLRGMVIESPHVFVEPICLDNIGALPETYRTTDLGAKLEHYHGDNVEWVFGSWTRVWPAPEFRDWNIEEYLPAVRVPTLVIQGEDDEYGTVRQVEAVAARAAGPVETLMLADCGHEPHRDREEEVLEAMAAFIRDRIL